MPAVSVAVAGLATMLALAGFGWLRRVGLWQTGDEVLVPFAVIWCVVTAAATAVAAVRVMADASVEEARRDAAAVAAVAATGTVPPVLLATAWAAVDGPHAASTRSTGLAAAVAAVAVGYGAWRHPAVRRGVLAWTAWAALTGVLPVLAGVGPARVAALTGGDTVLAATAGRGGVAILAGSLGLVAVLAGYAARRGERLAVLGAVVGPRVATGALAVGSFPGASGMLAQPLLLGLAIAVATGASQVHSVRQSYHYLGRHR